jgi:hypothetical protein
VSTTCAQPRRRHLAAGSPGVPGYVMAFVVSAGVLGLMAPLSVLLSGLARGSWSLDELFYGSGVGVLTATYALVYGLPAAAVGCLLVHLVCLPVGTQPVHVAMAGLTGAAAGVIYNRVVFDGFDGTLWLQLAIATSIGRTAVIPLARRRQS